MAGRTTDKAKLAETPEERETRLKANREARERADRRGMLINVEKAVKRARTALDDGDTAGHTTWLDVARTSLDSYARTARTTSPGATLGGVNHAGND